MSLIFSRSGSRVRAVAPARLLVSRNPHVPTARGTLSGLYVMSVLDMLHPSWVACIQNCGIRRLFFCVHNVAARPTLPAVFVEPSAVCVKKPAFIRAHFFLPKLDRCFLWKGTRCLNNQCLFVLLNPEVN